MANTNVMTSVLYGAPYWNGDTFVSEDDYSFILKDYEENFKNAFFNDLNKKASKDDRELLLSQIKDCIEKSRNLTWESLGVSTEEECQKALKAFNNLQLIEQRVTKWIDKIINAAIDDAIANDGDFSKKRYEENFSKYLRKAQNELNKLMTEINQFGENKIQRKDLKILARSLFLGEGTQTLINTDSSKYGVSGEIIVGISNAIKAALNEYGKNTVKIIDAKLIDTFKGKISDAITTEIIGTAGEKTDTKTVYYKDEKIITLLASVKRKKIGNLTAEEFFKESQDIKVDDSGSIINFFKSLQVKVNLPINEDLLEGFNTYWLNLLYFNQYNDSKKITGRKVSEIRNEINAFINTYAIIFLMTGKNGLIGKDFIQKIKSKLVLNKNPALLFIIPEFGIMPLYRILDQIYENIVKLLRQVQQNKSLPAMRSQMRLALRLDGIQSAVSKIDKISKENPSADIKDKNIFFQQGGHYVGTKGNLKNKDNIEDILNERYRAFGSGIDIKIFLLVPGGALNSILSKYV